MAVKRPKSDDSALVDYIIAHPEMSATACIVACGWKEGSVGKILNRIRPELDRRLAQNSAKVDKAVVKELTRFDALQNIADIANSWRKTGKPTSLHLAASQSYAHLSGQTPEAKQIISEIYFKLGATEFIGYSQEEIEHYTRTGERPARLTLTGGAAQVH